MQVSDETPLSVDANFARCMGTRRGGAWQSYVGTQTTTIDIEEV